MASSIFSVPFGGSGSVGNVVGINTLTNAQHFVDVADSAMYTVVADEAARLALTTPYDRYVYQTDTAEVWYWDTVGSAWEKDTPVIKHFVDSGNAYHHLLLPEYSLLKTLGDTIHEYEIWEGITSGTGGTVTVPTHGTIVLDQYVGGSDCLITKVDATTGRPVDEPARDSGGAIVTGTLDIAGNYTLSAAPDAYPVAIIFQIQLAERYKTAELTPAQILNETELPIAARVSFDDTVSLLGAGNVQDAIDLIRTQADTSHGVVTLPTITDNLDGSVAVGAGVANFGTAADGDGVIVRLATPAADPVALTDGQVNYVYADYNAGTPTIAVTLVPSGFIGDARLVPMFRVIREGTDLHILDYDEYAIGLADKLFYKEVTQRAFERQSGLVLSTAATRISTVSAGAAWFGVQLYTLDANVAGSAGELEYYYPIAGVWNKTTVTAYDSTYYSDGTNRQTLGVAKYVAKYFFRGVETDNHVYYISGNQKNSAAEALAEAVPAAPSVITSHSLYVGKIVIKQGATNGTAYPRQWEGTVSTAGAVNHNDLANRDAAGSHATFTPLADSTTAFQFFKADGTTPVLQIDTTNELIRCKTYMSGSDDVLRLKNDASTATLSIYDDGTADLTATDNILVYDTVSNFNWLELDRVVGMTVSKSSAQSILGANYLQLNSGTFVTEMESGLISYDGTEVLGFTDTALTIYPSVIKPDADATTAIQITKADGTTSVLSVDTTNGAINLDTNPSTAALTERKVFTATMSNTPDSTIHSAMVKFQVPDDGVEPVAIFTSEQDDNDINTFGYFAAQAGNFRIGIAKKSENIPLLTPAIFGSASLVEITPNTKFSGNITTNGTAVFSKDVRAANNLIVGDNPGTTSKRQLLLYENSATAQLIQFCNSATGFASSSDGFVTGITSAGVGYIWHYDNLGISFGTNNTSAGQITASGYWQIGSGAPSIKMKKLTGTTASTEGGTVTVSHGLTGDKIISVTGIVRNDTNEGVVNGVVYYAGYQFDISYNSSAIAISNHSTNSEEILSKPFVVTIFYEA